jgi:hypothetical protein
MLSIGYFSNGGYMKLQSVIVTVAIVLCALFVYQIINNNKLTADLKQKESAYVAYKDSVNQATQQLNKKLDSLAAAKNKVDTRIKYVPVYVNELKTQSDSTIALKVDEAFKLNTDTPVPKDSSFKSTALTIKNESDSLSGIFIHRNVAIDYLASVELMQSYKLLSYLNQQQIDVWVEKYNLETSLRQKSEGLNVDYKDAINSQEKQIRMYRSVAIGAGCGVGAAVLKGTATEVGISTVAGFTVSYLYSWIF